MAGSRERIETFARVARVDLTTGQWGPDARPEGPVRMVMVLDVLEHLHDSPRDLLDDLLELVEDDGYLLVTVPNPVDLRKRIDVLRGRTNLPPYNLFYWLPEPWRGHVREYVRSDLEALAQYLGLEILELDGAHHMLAKVPMRVRPLYRRVTGPFPGFRDSWVMLCRKRSGWIPRRTLEARDLMELEAEGTPLAKGTPPP